MLKNQNLVYTKLDFFAIIYTASIVVENRDNKTHILRWMDLLHWLDKNQKYPLIRCFSLKGV